MERKELLQKRLEETHKAIQNLPAGSEERKREEDVFVKLYDLANNEMKIEYDEYFSEQKIETEKEVKLKEIETKLQEIDIKNAQIEMERKMKSKPSADTMLICTDLTLMTLLVYLIEGRGVITPKALNHVEKLTRFLRII